MPCTLIFQKKAMNRLNGVLQKFRRSGIRPNVYPSCNSIHVQPCMSKHYEEALKGP